MKVIKRTAKAVARLAPSAVVVWLANVILLFMLTRVASREFGRRRWMLAFWHALWDDGPFVRSLMDRLGDAFAGTLRQLRLTVIWSLLLAAVSTAWFQALAVSNALDQTVRRRSAAVHAFRRLPSLVLGWGFPAAGLWLTIRYPLRPLLVANSDWMILIGWSLLIAVICLAAPHLVRVPTFVMAERTAPPGLHWLVAICRSIDMRAGRLIVIWELTFWKHSGRWRSSPAARWRLPL